MPREEMDDVTGPVAMKRSHEEMVFAVEAYVRQREAEAVRRFMTNVVNELNRLCAGCPESIEKIRAFSIKLESGEFG